MVGSSRRPSSTSPCRKSFGASEQRSPPHKTPTSLSTLSMTISSQIPHKGIFDTVGTQKRRAASEPKRSAHAEEQVVNKCVGRPEVAFSKNQIVHSIKPATYSQSWGPRSYQSNVEALRFGMRQGLELSAQHNPVDPLRGPGFNAVIPKVSLFVGLSDAPWVLKITPPNKGWQGNSDNEMRVFSRFHAVAVDSRRCLMADAYSNQVYSNQCFCAVS